MSRRQSVSAKKEDLETPVAAHSSKLETAVSKMSALDDDVAELHADLDDLPQQLKMDAMRVDVRKSRTIMMEMALSVKVSDIVKRIPTGTCCCKSDVYVMCQGKCSGEAKS